ncbi:ATP-binding protein [Marmoricola sp. URHB0036]|uniref:ATP-binding protein n=1 Tax=Marmoricola sp. URHB0036 TaxID=1298863 RepID=UPI0006889167|nr:ATP-binding protein [Marmoricola sp. URHB0036]
MNPTASPSYAPRRAYRSTDDRWLGGVASGLAQHLGLPALWVRIGLLALVAFGGFGAVLYAGLWMFMPTQRHTTPQAPGLDAASRQGKRGGRRERRLADYGPLVAVGAIAIGVLLLVTLATGQSLSFGPLLLAGAGVAVLWWQADEAQRQRWLDPSRRMNPLRAIVGGGGWKAWLRIVAGLMLLIGAIVLFSLRSGSLSVALNVGLAAAFGILGLGFMVGPWLLRLSSDLSEEREARVRSEERADVAAHLHDSVLQTLALIQRSAGDPATVTRLARAQERDLRSWLFDSSAEGPATLAAALRAVAAEVEDAHGVHVEVVCVGDAPVSEEDRPLVLATREAITNAAKHSGVSTVDVYAEATPSGVEVFVRDRGTGFDAEHVADDRQGIRGSIVGRMERHGGTGTVRSVPGEGTEVRLSLPTRVNRPKETTP